MTEIVENNMLHLSFEDNHIVSAEIQHEEEFDSQQVVEICEKKMDVSILNFLEQNMT